MIRNQPKELIPRLIPRLNPGQLSGLGRRSGALEIPACERGTGHLFPSLPFPSYILIPAEVSGSFVRRIRLVCVELGHHIAGDVAPCDLLGEDQLNPFNTFPEDYTFQARKTLPNTIIFRRRIFHMPRYHSLLNPPGLKPPEKRNF
ncbi:hypothetical protein NHX12_011543 [Muraenolepis orangiensis]|uniref:Uncharacterized protein n=1 Tax=Muraenolepis orangiensis TaxID=630683 RepID=A0A9Q0DGD2_9TELE|nr:hypothetical protein NHX12_011543 [Muraenolepis orangiensis]